MSRSKIDTFIQMGLEVSQQLASNSSKSSLFFRMLPNYVDHKISTKKSLVVKTPNGHNYFIIGCI
jgi:hypothetical protein